MIVEHNYTERGIVKAFKDLYECIKHFWIKKRCLKVDFIGTVHPSVRNEQGYDRKEYWTDQKPEDLHAMGYRSIEGLKNSLVWWGVPIYAKIYNIRTIEITDPEFSKDTPMTLDDRMHSNLTTKFAKSLARATALAGMDMQKLILMAGIGIAAFVGMKYFGVF